MGDSIDFSIPSFTVLSKTSPQRLRWGEQQSDLDFNVQQREPLLMDWGEMNFGELGKVAKR